MLLKDLILEIGEDLQRVVEQFSSIRYPSDGQKRDAAEARALFDGIYDSGVSWPSDLLNREVPNGLARQARRCLDDARSSLTRDPRDAGKYAMQHLERAWQMIGAGLVMK